MAVGVNTHLLLKWIELPLKKKKNRLDKFLICKAKEKKKKTQQHSKKKKEK